MCFRLSIWLNGHRESQKYEFANWIPRTNEAAGLIVLSPNSAQNHTWFKCALLIRSRSLGRILPVEERDNRRLIVTGRNYIRWVISLIFTSKNKNLFSHFFCDNLAYMNSCLPMGVGGNAPKHHRYARIYIGNSSLPSLVCFARLKWFSRGSSNVC